jgi:hypothetical protein
MDSAVCENFTEPRNQIDLAREELWLKIDSIEFEMIDKIKIFDQLYLKNLNEQLHVAR